MNNNIPVDEFARWLPMLGTPEIKEANLPANFIERLKRVRGVYDYWLQFPNKTMTHIVQWEEDMFGIKKTQAYCDIRLVKVLLGDLEKSTKDFWRLRINAIILEQMEIARRRQDTRSLAAMQKNLILNNKTNLDDPLELEYAAIQPSEFKMSDDIGIVIPGKKKTSRQEKKRIARKYGIEIEDADFEVIEENEEPKEEVNEEQEDSIL